MEKEGHSVVFCVVKQIKIERILELAVPFSLLPNQITIQSACEAIFKICAKV